MQPLLDLLGPFFGGPQYVLILLLAIVKIGAVLGMVMGVVPFVVLYERKLLGWIQVRPGPNRVGPWGILQGIIDGAKLFMKEEIVPKMVDRPLYYLAPAIITCAAVLALSIIPFGPIVSQADTLALYKLLGLKQSQGLPVAIPLAVTNLNVGIFFVFAISSLSVYGITLAGWSSDNKWSLLGGLRASAQMISYEITVGLAIAGVLLLAGSLNLYEIIRQQQGGILNWFVWYQPIGFVLFLIGGFAETNRLPFDLPEAESELTGGYHTEYSSMKFALFFLSEYINMIVFSAMACTLFLGGFTGVAPLSVVWAGAPSWVSYLLGPAVLFAKIIGFLTLFIVVRGFLPRLRYDQLMNFGWKVMLPLGLANFALTSVLLGLGVTNRWVHFVAGMAILVILDQILSRVRKSQLRSRYRYYAREAA